MRAAICRSARSASARRSTSACERASASIRFAFTIAIDACVASADSVSTSASVYVPGSRDTTDKHAERARVLAGQRDRDDRPDAGLADELLDRLVSSRTRLSAR